MNLELFSFFLQRLLSGFVNFEEYRHNMKKSILFSSLFLVSHFSFAQKVSSNLKFEQGQVLHIVLDLKTTIAQQAMGQAIDFAVNATGNHSYKVTNTNADNSTLKHKVDRIVFSFDGMGQKRNFDSKEEKRIKERSFVWSHFEKITDDKNVIWAKCKYCR